MKQCKKIKSTDTIAKMHKIACSKFVKKRYRRILDPKPYLRRDCLHTFLREVKVIFNFNLQQ